MDYSIQVNSLDFSYEKKEIFKDLSLSFEKGGCYCGGDTDIFNFNKSYSFTFIYNDWDINLVPLNSWDRIYYNCLSSGLCYYSHNKENSNSIETIYERNITIIESHDYDADYYDDAIKAISAVRWKERGIYKQVSITADFYN